jgi:hypothetical protein
MASLLVDSVTAREMLGVSVGQFRRMRKRGLLPQPLPGTRLYPRDAIKKLVDNKPGIQELRQAAGARLDERTAKWGKST